MTTRISKTGVTRAALAALLLAFGGVALTAVPATVHAAEEKKEEPKADAKAKKPAKEEKAAAKTEEAAAAAPAGEQGSIKLGNPTVAVVDGEEVKRSDVFTFISSLPQQYQQMPIEQLFPMALDNVVNNKIALKKSAGADISADPEVTKLFEEAKQNIVRSVYIDRQITAKINQKALLKKYEELLDQIGEIDEVKARHILVDSEEKAKEAIKKLDGGADFVTVTKEVWPGAAEQNGGELGYFAKGDMVAEFAEAAFALGKDQYTKDPVKTQFGWHVIKVEDKRKRPQPEFEAVKPQLEMQLRQDILGNLLKDWAKEAKVKKFDINGDPVKEVKAN